MSEYSAQSGAFGQNDRWCCDERQSGTTCSRLRPPSLLWETRTWPNVFPPIVVVGTSFCFLNQKASDYVCVRPSLSGLHAALCEFVWTIFLDELCLSLYCLSTFKIWRTILSNLRVKCIYISVFPQILQCHYIIVGWLEQILRRNLILTQRKTRL